LLFLQTGRFGSAVIAEGEIEAVAKKDAETTTKKEAATPKKEAVESQVSQSKFDLKTFFQQTQVELDKVVWPSRQQLISESLAVLLMVTLSAMLIYGVDQLFTWAAHQVFG
jgi:preprotein translocase subunit SecE